MVVTDGVAYKRYDTPGEAARAIRNWFDYLVEDGRLENLPELREPEAEEDLQDYADYVCEQVAEALGYRPWHGHGNYVVPAAAEAGLHLRIKEEGEEN